LPHKLADTLNSGMEYLYRYDKIGQMTESLTTINGLRQDTKYTYDNNGRLIKSESSDPTSKLGVKYTYNNLGELIELNNGANLDSGGKSISRFYNIKYDTVGNRIGYDYDISPLLRTNVTHDASGSVVFTYNKRDELIKEDWKRNNHSVFNGNFTFNHAYDDEGNTTTLRSATKTYNAKDQIIGVSYDANGNATTYSGYSLSSPYSSSSLGSPWLIDPGMSYGFYFAQPFDYFTITPYEFTLDYDVNDRLTTLTGGPITSTGAPRKYSYAYTSEGTRYVKKSDKETVYYLYSEDKLVALLDSAGKLVQGFRWGETGLQGYTYQSGNNENVNMRCIFDPEGNLLHTTRDDSLPDQPGTTLLFDAYGKMRSGRAMSWYHKYDATSLGYKAQYGYYTDVESGLIYCKNRYYDPTSARWITRDPIGLEGGVNVYRYVDGDPIGQVDPDGLQTRTRQYKSIATSDGKLQLGRYAVVSIKATTAQPTDVERVRVTTIGKEYGCHTCGTKTSGHPDGHFTPDHQPATKSSGHSASQRLYPQCKKCSDTQGANTKNLAAYMKKTSQTLDEVAKGDSKYANAAKALKRTMDRGGRATTGTGQIGNRGTTPPDKLGKVGGAGKLAGTVAKMGKVAGIVAKTVGKAGKVLGPLGFVFGAADFQEAMKTPEQLGAKPGEYWVNVMRSPFELSKWEKWDGKTTVISPDGKAMLKAGVGPILSNPYTSICVWGLNWA
jgi:RHS repeat-associated protein